MKKTADFIVEKNKIIMLVIIAITVFCALLIPKVEVITDMAKYLPNSSSMKQGLDIMDEEFDAEADKTIRVMFTDLKSDQKLEIKEELEKIEYVDRVDYDEDDEDYNKDKYTKYVVYTQYDYGSDEENAIEAAIDSDFKYNDMVYLNDSDNTTLPVLGLSIAFIVLFAVLFAMSGSYIEPILFVFTIGLAIVINLGTNIFIGSVSQTTFAIAAILQMVLSMDYSVILMNRYRQKMWKIPEGADKKAAMKPAMKKAWVESFSSVWGSSLTTVVGLLMLCFMRFKIGADMGIVLAKGVFISVLCVLFFLPGLILMCGKLLEKFRKRVLTIPTGILGKAAFKGRVPLSLVFLGVFVLAFFGQRMTDIGFGIYKEDPIADVFPEKETVVMLYDNDDEEAATQIAYDLEDNSYVDETMNYTKTLHDDKSVFDMVSALDEFGADDYEGDYELDEDTLRMIYYDYYTDGKIYDMSMSQFLTFLADDVITNENMSSRMSDEVKESASDMKKFANAKDLTKKRNIESLAEFLDIDKEDVSDLMLYYVIENGSEDEGTLSIEDFLGFVIDEVSTNERYKDQFDDETVKQLKRLRKIVAMPQVSEDKTYARSAQSLEMDEADMKLLYAYYLSNSSDYEPSDMTVEDFVSYIIKISSKEPFSSEFSKAQIKQLKSLKSYTKKSYITKKRSAKNMASAMGMDASQVKMIYSLYYVQDVSSKKMTLSQFSSYLVSDIMNNELFSSSMSSSDKESINQLNSIISIAASNQKLSAAELAQVLSMDEDSVAGLISYYNAVYQKEASKLTLSEFTSFLSDVVMKDENYSSMFTSSQAASIIQLNTIALMASSNQKLTYNQICEVFSMDADECKLIYRLYFGSKTSGKKMSIYQMADFILNDLANDSMMSSGFDKDTISNLKTLKGIMDAAKSGKKLAYAKMASLLSMEKAQAKMIYTLYASDEGKIESQKLSLKQILDFIIKNRSIFESSMSGDDFKNLKMLSKLVDAAISNKALSAYELSEILDMDEEDIKSLYLFYIKEHGDTSLWKMSVADMIVFIEDKVLADEEYADLIDKDEAEDIHKGRIIVDSVVSGKKYSPTQLQKLFSKLSDEEMSAKEIELLYLFYDSTIYSDKSWTMNIISLMDYLAEDMIVDDRFDEYIDDDAKDDIKEMRDELIDGVNQIRGENYSRLIITTTLPQEGEAVDTFYENLKKRADSDIKGNYYLIGSTAMNYEMGQTFHNEYLLISILTAIAIFAVVAFTFKSLMVPLLLVLIVQCGVFITVSVVGLQGYSIYYLALLIVQSILMGATIDYGILFSTYYREGRKKYDRLLSLKNAYAGSMHTILTSGLIMVLATAVLSFLYGEESVEQICRTISIGALSAIILIVTLLPALLALLDRFVVGKSGHKE